MDVSHVAYGAAVTTMLEPAQRGSPNSSSHSSCNSSCRATLLYTTDTSHVKWSMMSMHKSDRKSEDQCIAPSVKNWFQIWPSLWFDVAIAHEAAQGNACTKKSVIPLLEYSVSASYLRERLSMVVFIIWLLGFLVH